MKRKTYTARCVREGSWWIVTIDELDGVFTHARRVDQVEQLARDAIALWLDAEPDRFDVVVDIEIAGNARSALDEAIEARRDAETAKTQAALTTTAAVVELFRGGLPLRDVGALVGISHQRVAQILDDAEVERSA